MPINLRRRASVAIAVVCLSCPLSATALDIGVDLGGLGVDVSVGGDSGVGVGVGVGDVDVNVGVGGDDGLGLQLDLDGDGINETSTDGLGPGLQLRPLGQEDTLQAVRSNRALPLEDILVRARLVTSDEIIDAQLIQVRRILVYEIKVLGKSGEVRDLYFYARSGALVAPE